MSDSSPRSDEQLHPFHRSVDQLRQERQQQIWTQQQQRQRLQQQFGQWQHSWHQQQQSEQQPQLHHRLEPDEPLSPDGDASSLQPLGPHTSKLQPHHEVPEHGSFLGLANQDLVAQGRGEVPRQRPNAPPWQIAFRGRRDGAVSGGSRAPEDHSTDPDGVTGDPSTGLDGVSAAGLARRGAAQLFCALCRADLPFAPGGVQELLRIQHGVAEPCCARCGRAIMLEAPAPPTASSSAAPPHSSPDPCAWGGDPHARVEGPGLRRPGDPPQTPAPLSPPRSAPAPWALEGAPRAGASESRPSLGPVAQAPGAAASMPRTFTPPGPRELSSIVGLWGVPRRDASSGSPSSARQGGIPAPPGATGARHTSDGAGEFPGAPVDAAAEPPSTGGSAMGLASPEEHPTGQPWTGSAPAASWGPDGAARHGGNSVALANIDYPEVVWCGFEPGTEPLMPQPGQVRRYCRGHVHFLRWLFSQDRGLIDPFAALLVTWREARACLSGMEAARMGTTSRLRSDSRRPALRDVVGPVPQDTLPTIAVGSVTVFTDGEESHERASRYVANHQADFPGIAIEVVPLHHPEVR
eukprot:CAMPEP_0175433778 /NCGR_PEP_ID=MMETSP0095-20121207/53567_1 /TAXON_ID=311494 /ORGANISM="Alexandrium monilatum, Strain CCMP3105" /LENGTH=577 /DNA_ID=CAMNT_0016733305 /DNA_START=27 /DNA_END=1757 /DNA_ORIENTATION=+